jgi:TetR/AcrR family transcriptional regulator, cholesterol catabolism regulator
VTRAEERGETATTPAPPALGLPGTSPTAHAIYEVAVDLFFRQGFEATSLRQIADIVGIKVGSLYNHIRSKEELLYTIMHGVMTSLGEQSNAALDAVPPDGPHGRLRAFLRAAVEFHAHNQQAAFIGNTELRALEPVHRHEIVRLRDAYQERLEELVGAVADVDRGAGIRNVKLASFAAVAISSHVSSWYRRSGELTIDDVVDGLLDVYRPVARTPR